MELPPVGVGDRDGRNAAGKRRRQERGNSRGGPGSGIGDRRAAEKRGGRGCREETTAGVPPGSGIGDRRAAGKRVGRVCRRKEMAGRNREEVVRGGAAERHRADRRGADRGPREQRGTAGVQRKRERENGCPGRERAKTGAGADHRPARPGRPIKATSCSGRTRWSAPSRRSSERSQRDSPTGYSTPRWWHASPVRASS